jgi:hypothetical protein
MIVRRRFVSFSITFVLVGCRSHASPLLPNPSAMTSEQAAAAESSLAGPADMPPFDIPPATSPPQDVPNRPTPPNDPPVVPNITDCASGEPGVFVDITPREVKEGMPTTHDGGGPFALAVDPVNQGTLYMGTLFQGLWKSTDCGANWEKIAKNGNADEIINSGMNWTLAVDPQDPQVVYTNSGYGAHGGMFKSSDGGRNWEVIWPPAEQPTLSAMLERNFANVIALDPSNHLHLLLTFHESCRGQRSQACIAESFDAGHSWQMVEGLPGWDGNEGQVIYFLDHRDAWIWGSQTNGFWRTGDAGQTWERIAGANTVHLQGCQLARRPDGRFFLASYEGIWTSPDGLASTWELIPQTGPAVGGLVASEETLFASRCYAYGLCGDPANPPRYLRSALGDGRGWTPLPSPPIPIGGTMGYDQAHHMLYSSNTGSGLWRVIVQ